VRQPRAQYRRADKLDRQIAARESETLLRQNVLDYQRRIDAAPGHESELAELMRETHQKLYTSLLAKKEDRRSGQPRGQQVGEH
jgi:hypothetical protein